MRHWKLFTVVLAMPMAGIICSGCHITLRSGAQQDAGVSDLVSAADVGRAVDGATTLRDLGQQGADSATPKGRSASTLLSLDDAGNLRTVTLDPTLVPAGGVVGVGTGPSGGVWAASAIVMRHLVEQHGYRRIVVLSGKFYPNLACGEVPMTYQEDRTLFELATWICNRNLAHPNDPIRVTHVGSLGSLDLESIILSAYLSDSGLSLDALASCEAYDTPTRIELDLSAVRDEVYSGQRTLDPLRHAGCLDGIAELRASIASSGYLNDPAREAIKRRLKVYLQLIEAMNSHLMTYPLDPNAADRVLDLAVSQVVLDQHAAGQGVIVWASAETFRVAKWPPGIVGASSVQTRFPVGPTLRDVLGDDYRSIWIHATDLQYWNGAHTYAGASALEPLLLPTGVDAALFDLGRRTELAVDVDAFHVADLEMRLSEQFDLLLHLRRSRAPESP